MTLDDGLDIPNGPSDLHISGLPYTTSREYNPKGLWYDSFVKREKIRWGVFLSDEVLAWVETEAQAKNIMKLPEKLKEKF